MISELKKDLINIYKIIVKKNKLKIFLLFISMFLIVAAETLSLSSFLPFFDILFSQLNGTQTSFVFSKNIINFLSNYQFNEIIFILSLSLIIIFLLKNILVIFLVYINQSIVNYFHYLIGEKNLDFFYNKSYESLNDFELSEIFRNVMSEPKHIVNYFSSLINIFIESLIAISLIVIIIITQPLGILSLIAALVACLSIFFFSFTKLRKWGESRFKSSSDTVKYLVLPFANNAEIRILNLGNTFRKLFLISSFNQLKAAFKFSFLQSINKYVLEIFFVTSILSFLIFISKNPEANLSGSLTYLSALTIITFRLIPCANKLISSFQAISFSSKSMKNLETVLIDDKNNLNKKEFIELDQFHNFSLNNLTFKYKKNNNTVLNDLSLNIQQGDKIAISGDSGSGKSTLLKIISGLLEPTSGKIFYNGHQSSFYNCRWGKRLSYIPQKSFIFNGTLLLNITLDFNNKKADLIRMNQILNICHLTEIVNNLDNGILSDIIDDGNNFSSGQVQRIAIARSLYSSPEVLILDEATNALDKFLQEDIIRKILNIENLTLICVSHDPAVLKHFLKIYRFSDGKIIN
jgi:ABC-type bacteriocin/lantibiotic exporter with double-glycine peptidase domain